MAKVLRYEGTDGRTDLLPSLSCHTCRVLWDQSSSQGQPFSPSTSGFPLSVDPPGETMFILWYLTAGVLLLHKTY